VNWCLRDAGFAELKSEREKEREFYFPNESTGTDTQYKWYNATEGWLPE